jgi:hypothetical protein
MSPPTPPLRVAVAAAPPLLADTLRALMADEVTQVTLLTDRTSDRFDVAIVTDGCAPEVPAAVHIRLDESAASTGGGIAHLPGGAELVLDDLTALLDLVHGLATGSPPIADLDRADPRAISPPATPRVASRPVDAQAEG